MYVSGPLQTEGSSDGMVLDFGDIKVALCKLHEAWDHGLLLEATDPLCTVAGLRLGKLFLFSGPPTAENIAAFALKFLKTELEKDGVTVDCVVFWETPTSRAIVERQIELCECCGKTVEACRQEQVDIYDHNHIEFPDGHIEVTPTGSIVRGGGPHA